MPKPKYNDKTVIVRLPADLADAARLKAEREKRPLSEVIREQLRAWVAAEPAPAAK
jgi:hypothetical protein